MTQKSTGPLGEAIAARHLEAQGWRILERNFYGTYGEVDIIACDAQYVLFVEVKTRRPGGWGSPAQAVNLTKRRRLLLTAQEYLAQVPLSQQPRIDVCEVYLSPLEARINYIQNAF